MLQVPLLAEGDFGLQGVCGTGRACVEEHSGNRASVRSCGRQRPSTRRRSPFGCESASTHWATSRTTGGLAPDSASLMRSMVLASSRKCNPARGTRVTPPDSPEVTWLRSDWTSYARLTMWFVLDESDHSAADHFARRRGAAGVLQESLGAYAGRTTLRPEWLVLRLTHAVATGSSACRSGHHAVDTKQGGCFGPRRGHCSGHWGAFAVCGVGPP